MTERNPLASQDIPAATIVGTINRSEAEGLFEQTVPPETPQVLGAVASKAAEVAVVTSFDGEKDVPTAYVVASGPNRGDEIINPDRHQLPALSEALQQTETGKSAPYTMLGVSAPEATSLRLQAITLNELMTTTNPTDTEKTDDVVYDMILDMRHTIENNNGDISNAEALKSIVLAGAAHEPSFKKSAINIVQHSDFLNSQDLQMLEAHIHDVQLIQSDLNLSIDEKLADIKTYIGRDLEFYYNGQNPRLLAAMFAHGAGALAGTQRAETFNSELHTLINVHP